MAKVNEHSRQLRAYDSRNQGQVGGSRTSTDWVAVAWLQYYRSQGSLQGSGLLSLPAELRLEAYHHLLNAGNRPHHQNDEIDIARFTSFDSASDQRRISTKTYGWLLTHPVVFREALCLVVATHPLVFYDLDKIQGCQDIIQPARNIILDLETAAPNAIRQALHRIKHLPNLEPLEFRVSPSNIRHVRLFSEMGGFASLVNPIITDTRLLREEQRHDNQYFLEVQPFEEKIRMLDAEILARENGTSQHNEAENFTTPVGDFSRLHLWSTVELTMTKHDIQLKLLWRGLKNSPAPYSGSTERRNLLYCQRALLKKDMSMRNEKTEEDRSKRELYEERCQECMQCHL